MKTIARILLLALASGLQAWVIPANASSSAPAADVMPLTVVSDHCSWDHPGVNPFMGDLVAAVDRYRDIPADVRARLKARMEKREYEDLVTIRRDSIDGRGGYDYGKTITDMHFGTHQLCRSVTRSTWSPQMQERGLVYCESGYCILVPTVCRNVSRITRSGVGPDAAAAAPLLAAAPAEDPYGALPPIDWSGPAGAGMPDDVALPTDGSVGQLPIGEGAPTALLPTFAGGVFAGAVASAGPGEASSGRGTETVHFNSPPASEVSHLLTAPVPEPETWMLLALGLATVAAVARRSGRPS